MRDAREPADTPTGGHSLEATGSTVGGVNVRTLAGSFRSRAPRGAAPSDAEAAAEVARTLLHDEVIPALTSAMLRLHLLVTRSEEPDELGSIALVELEHAAAGVRQVMAELSVAPSSEPEAEAVGAGSSTHRVEHARLL